MAHEHANGTRTSLLREKDKGGELPIGGALRRVGRMSKELAKGIVKSWQ